MATIHVAGNTIHMNSRKPNFMEVAIQSITILIAHIVAIEITIDTKVLPAPLMVPHNVLYTENTQ